MKTTVIKGTYITALFDTHEEADRAVRTLRQNGVTDDAMSIIGRHEDSDSIVTGEPGDSDVVSNTHVARGAMGGGALGAGLAFATVLIPGIGPFIAGGILATTLTAGVAIGASIGGIGEALRSHGMNEAEAKYYEDKMAEGSVMIGIDLAATNVSEEAVNTILLSTGGHPTDENAYTSANSIQNDPAIV